MYVLGFVCMLLFMCEWVKGCILEEAIGKCGSLAALTTAVDQQRCIKGMHRGQELYFPTCQDGQIREPLPDPEREEDQID